MFKTVKLIDENGSFKKVKHIPSPSQWPPEAYFSVLETNTSVVGDAPWRVDIYGYKNICRTKFLFCWSKTKGWVVVGQMFFKKGNDAVNRWRVENSSKVRFVVYYKPELAWVEKIFFLRRIPNNTKGYEYGYQLISSTEKEKLSVLMK